MQIKVKVERLISYIIIYCQWLFLVGQTKLTKVHFKTQELVLGSVAGFVNTPALLPNLII